MENKEEQIPDDKIKCDICGKITSKKNKKDHLKIHNTNYKPPKKLCPNCGKMKSTNNMAKHLKICKKTVIIENNNIENINKNNNTDNNIENNVENNNIENNNIENNNIENNTETNNINFINYTIICNKNSGENIKIPIILENGCYIKCDEIDKNKFYIVCDENKKNKKVKINFKIPNNCSIINPNKETEIVWKTPYLYFIKNDISDFEDEKYQFCELCKVKFSPELTEEWENHQLTMGHVDNVFFKFQEEHRERVWGLIKKINIITNKEKQKEFKKQFDELIKKIGYCKYCMLILSANNINSHYKSSSHKEKVNKFRKINVHLLPNYEGYKCVSCHSTLYQDGSVVICSNIECDFSMNLWGNEKDRRINFEAKLTYLDNLYKEAFTITINTEDFNECLEQMKKYDEECKLITKKYIKSIIPKELDSKTKRTYLYGLVNKFYEKPELTKENMERIKETFIKILHYLIENNIKDSVNYEFYLSRIVTFLNIDIIFPYDDLKNIKKQKEKDELWEKIKNYLSNDNNENIVEVDLNKIYEDIEKLDGSDIDHFENELYKYFVDGEDDEVENDNELENDRKSPIENTREFFFNELSDEELKEKMETKITNNDNVIIKDKLIIGNKFTTKPNEINLIYWQCYQQIIEDNVPKNVKNKGKYIINKIKKETENVKDKMLLKLFEHIELIHSAKNWYEKDDKVYYVM